MDKKYRILLLAILLLPCLGIGRLGGGDLQVYRNAGAFVLKGQPALAYLESASIGNYFDGVPFLVFTKVLASMDSTTCKWFWLTVQAISYVAFWFFLTQIFPDLLSGRRALAFWIVWSASIKPIHASFQSFNVQLILAAVLVFAEFLTEKKSETAQMMGGFFLPVITLWKVYPGFILVYYFLTKPKSVRYGIYLGAAFGLALPGLVFGPLEGARLYGLFIQNLATYHHAYPLTTMAVSLSLPSFIATWFAFLGPVLLSQVITLVVIASSLCFFGYVWFSKQDNSGSEGWALAMALMVFLNNGSRPDYFIFYLPAFAVVMMAWEKERVSALFKTAAISSFAMIALISEWTLQSRDFNHYLERLRIPVVGMMILCGLLIHAIMVLRQYDQNLSKS